MSDNVIFAPDDDFNAWEPSEEDIINANEANDYYNEGIDEDISDLEEPIDIHELAEQIGFEEEEE